MEALRATRFIYTHSTVPCILYTLLLCFDPLVFFLVNDSAVFCLFLMPTMEMILVLKLEFHPNWQL